MGHRMRCGAAALVLVLVAAGCSGDGDGDTGQATPDGGGARQSPAPSGAGKPIQSRTMGWPGKVQVDLMALNRHSSDVVVARFRLVNNGSQTYGPQVYLTGQQRAGENAASGVSLVDPANAKRHLPLRTTDRQCLCTRYTVPPELEPGESYDVVAAFPAPPEGVRRAAVVFPHTPAFTGVPLAGGGGGGIVFQRDTQPVDPGQVDTMEPTILPITATTEAVDGTRAEDDKGRDRSVRLSTDVLFELNKAELTSRAESVLSDVAKQIDRSPSRTVRIDGHTDSSGNDAINEPLSRRRAAAVRGKLEELVTRNGVGYETAGHGSKKPVADNKTKKGRKKNRRVTVTFAKPQEQRTPTGTDAPGPPESAGPVTVQQTGQPETAVGGWPENMRAEVRGLTRGPNGYATLVWTVHNDGPGTLNAGTAFSEGPPYNGSGPEGVALVAGEQRYKTLRDSERACLCPRVSAELPVFQLEADSELLLWNMYRVPADVDAVTVEIPGFEPAKNVPVG